MKTITTCIVDDETQARTMLRVMLEHFCPQVNIIGEFENIHTALPFIEQQQPKLLFTDLIMPRGSYNMEILKRLRVFQDTMHYALLTGHADLVAKRKLFTCQHVYLLHKPLRSKDLKSLMQTIIISTKANPN